MKQEIQDPTPRQMNSDPMRIVYLEAEQVVHLTVLALVSRVAPLPDNPLQFVSNYALATSRAALDAHQRGLDVLCTLTQESEVVNRHLNWFVSLACCVCRFNRKDFSNT